MFAPWSAITRVICESVPGASAVVRSSVWGVAIVVASYYARLLADSSNGHRGIDADDAPRGNGAGHERDARDRGAGGEERCPLDAARVEQEGLQGAARSHGTGESQENTHE